MAVTKAIFCVQVNFTNTSTSIVNLGGVTQVTVRTSADVYIDFDQPVAPTESFKLLSANTSDTTIDGFGGTIQNLYVQGASGSGTLYIIAMTK